LLINSIAELSEEDLWLKHVKNKTKEEAPINTSEELKQ